MQRRRGTIRLHRLAGLAGAALFAFAATLRPAPAAPTAAAPPDVRGVYVIANTYFVGTGDVAGALKVDGVDGLLIHLRWNEITKPKTPKVYDWTFLDQTVALATKAGKKFEIGVVTGGSTPAWVYAAKPAGLGGVGIAFPFQNGSGDCQTLTMTAPWDPAYLLAFRDLLTQLSAHLKSTGGYASLAMVKLFGMTTITDELRLPAVLDNACNGNATTLWQGVGYTPARVKAAWSKMLAMYKTQFPDKSFDIGFIPRGAFPGIRPDGKAAATEAEAETLSNTLNQALIANAGLAFPGRLGLGFDSLVLTGDPSNATLMALEVQTATNDGLLHGWQTNESLGEAKGAACITTATVTAACRGPTEFQAMLMKGIFPDGRAATSAAERGKYVEVFPQNAVSFPAAILAAHRALFN